MTRNQRTVSEKTCDYQAADFTIALKVCLAFSVILAALKFTLTPVKADVKVRSYHDGAGTERSLKDKKRKGGKDKKEIRIKKEDLRPGGRPPPDQDFEPGEPIELKPKGGGAHVDKLDS